MIDVPHELNETICLLIQQYMHIHLQELSNYHFDEKLDNYLYDILYTQLYPLQESMHISSIIDKGIQQARETFYKHIMPRRSYRSTFATKPVNIIKMEKRIQQLRDIPQPDQRTDDWYKFRYRLITASNAYKAYGSQAKQNELICEKCKPLSFEKSNSKNMDTPFHWGIKYEPISVQYYEHVYNTTIEDFGCLPHPIYPFLGASPDGINVKPDAPFFGRMLEIKNPTTREITGIPKEEYWIQMQLQMEVCGLNHCDFLETKFIEYESHEAFQGDGTFQQTPSLQYKGIIIGFIVNDSIKYEYAPFQCTEEEFISWESQIMDKYAENTWLKNVYWKLDHVSCILVGRNKQWFQHTLHCLENIWDIIEKERISGKWIERKPKSNQRKRSSSIGNEEPKPIGKLIIDMTDI